MERFKDMTVRKKYSISMIRNLILFIGLIVFTFWFIFKDQDLNELIITIKSVNISYVILGALIMLLVYLTESYNVRSILTSLGEKKISMINALKFTFIGFFFSAITPAATGGQPVEIYYMTKEDISGPSGTMAMLLQLCGFQISTILISIICAFIYPEILSDGIIWFYLLGIVLNGIALAFMLIGIFSKKITGKIIDNIVKFMHKINVRSADKKAEKFREGFKKYNESADFILSHKSLFVKSVLRVFVQIIFYHSIPYCIYKAFGLSNYNFLQVFSMQAILYTTVSSLPLPGSIGVSESLFLKIFGLAFGKELLGGAMLINRFVSFYLYIIVTAVVVIVNAIKNKNIVGEIDKDVRYIDGSNKKLVPQNA